MNHAVQEKLPIMCLSVAAKRNQIHGADPRDQDDGPWLNVLDPTFHMHLRLDHISDVWLCVRPRTGM